jgi:hypothetical protein
VLGGAANDACAVDQYVEAGKIAQACCDGGSIAHVQLDRTFGGEAGGRRVPRRRRPATRR